MINSLINLRSTSNVYNFSFNLVLKFLFSLILVFNHYNFILSLFLSKSLNHTNLCYNASKSYILKQTNLFFADVLVHLNKCFPLLYDSSPNKQP